MQPRDLLLILPVLVLVGGPIWVLSDLLQNLWSEIESGYRLAFRHWPPGRPGDVS